MIFNYLEIPKRQEKPRNKGLTSVLDDGIGYKTAEDLMEVSNWIDIIKLGWGTPMVIPEHILKKKINLYKSHQIEVCNGGTLFEISYSQGKINEFFIKMKELGLSSVEISDGKIDIDSNEKGRIIEKAKNFGFKVYSEIGKKDPELDMKLNCKQRISHALNDLKVGARKVIMESRASGKLGIYDENCQVKENFVKKLVDGIGLDNIIFEAPRKNQQLWLILNFGSEVNLGNIKVKDVIPLETLRKGVRGDTFGKIP